MNRLQQSYFYIALLFTINIEAQLAVTVSSPKVTGQKMVITLSMKNNMREKVESARAVIFLLDEQGKMVGRSTKWVIGGNTSKAGLAAGATNSFNFVISASEPFASTNLTAKLSFSQLFLAGGKAANVKQDIQIVELERPTQDVQKH